MIACLWWALPLAGVVFLSMLNGFLGGARKAQVDAVLGMLMVSLVGVAFAVRLWACHGALGQVQQEVGVEDGQFVAAFGGLAGAEFQDGLGVLLPGAVEGLVEGDLVVRLFRRDVHYGVLRARAFLNRTIFSAGRLED